MVLRATPGRGAGRRARLRPRRSRVWLNGRDVTADTFYVDTRRGVVRMFKRDPNGRYEIEDLGPLRIATIERRGNVVVRIDQKAVV